MVDNARVLASDGAPETPNEIKPLPQVTWGVTRSSLLLRGDRRMEASTYLSDGYGRRVAIESRPAGGWSSVESIAEVWQPSRLKGIALREDQGVPFLSAGQVFETSPMARKWLSLDRTPDASDRFVSSGVLLLSRSGTVGRVTAVYRPHEGHLITDDLLRIDPRHLSTRGWLYAYMRTRDFRLMATGAHYGHMIKHLEPSHVMALPVVDVGDEILRDFEQGFVRIIAARNEAAELTEEAYETYAAALDVDVSDVDEGAPFTVPSSGFIRGRRRLDAYHHNRVVGRIRLAMESSAERIDMLPDVTRGVWWPNRFKREFGENGTPYVSAAELFDLNPPITKRIYAGLVTRAEDYFVEPGWILMARSGQIYGLNGRVFLASHRHSRFFVSEDIIRVVPDESAIRPGYLLAALGHPTLGRPMVLRHAYGTSIPHLEPSDLSGIAVARFDEATETSIADRMERAARLRSEADDLEDSLTQRAEDIIEVFLHDDL